jgi:hypothetical protein
MTARVAGEDAQDSRVAEVLSIGEATDLTILSIPFTIAQAALRFSARVAHVTSPTYLSLVTPLSAHRKYALIRRVRW